MKLIRKILFPVVPFYYLITWLRNKLYDWSVKKSISYNFPVICVGNLSVGGTGKTPMVEYLIKALKDNYNLAVLSRGYKRKTKGFKIANEESTVQAIGDEPFQFYTKYKKDVIVAVDSDRNHGIKKLRTLNNKPEIVLLDDAYQHRKVRANLNILLTTYTNPFYNDYVLPTGNLREPVSGANRANIIVVTKCPIGIRAIEKENIIKKIKPKKYQQVFFSSIVYSNHVFSADKTMDLDDMSRLTLITGIANAKPLIKYLKRKNLEFKHFNFSDHHEFSKQEILDLEKETFMVTTEKDFMRLKQYESLKNKLFYLPIEISIDNDIKFKKIINKNIKV